MEKDSPAWSWLVHPRTLGSTPTLLPPSPRGTDSHFLPSAKSAHGLLGPASYCWLGLSLLPKGLAHFPLMAGFTQNTLSRFLPHWGPGDLPPGGSYVRSSQCPKRPHPRASTTWTACPGPASDTGRRLGRVPARGARGNLPLPLSLPRLLVSTAPSLLRDRQPVGPWPLGAWPPCLVSVSSEASGVAGGQTASCGEETWIQGQ